MMNRSHVPAARGLTVSLVIPAYNEERHLAACLDAVLAQTVAPFEVIVVDNNSTDRTVEVASAYPFVRVVHEPRRGVVYARDAGFNAARGEIIARIDVDTLVPSDWIEMIQTAFKERPELDAVTGKIGFYDVPFERLFTWFELLCRRFVAYNLQRMGEMYLYGGNMALRRSAWQRVRHEVCHAPGFHEDIDLGAHFAHTGTLIGFDERLAVKISARRVDSSPTDYYPYVFANSRTYKAHGLASRFYMYPIELAVAALYPVFRVLYRSYDPARRRLSWRLALGRSSVRRISPIADTIY